MLYFLGGANVLGRSNNIPSASECICFHMPFLSPHVVLDAAPPRVHVHYVKHFFENGAPADGLGSAD